MRLSNWLAKASWPGSADSRCIAEGIVHVKLTGVTKSKYGSRGVLESAALVGTTASSTFLVSCSSTQRRWQGSTPSDSGAKPGLFCGGKIPRGICFNQPRACTVSDQGELYHKLGQDHRREGCRNIKAGEKDIEFAYGSQEREEKKPDPKVNRRAGSR